MRERVVMIRRAVLIEDPSELTRNIQIARPRDPRLDPPHGGPRGGESSCGNV
jgi:hypothetical protein